MPTESGYYYNVRSYVGPPRVWADVLVRVEINCAAHKRPCARLGGVCYPTVSFCDYVKVVANA